MTWPVSEAAACVLRLEVAPSTGDERTNRQGSGGTKFVLHALRVLVQEQAGGKGPRHDHELGACDASLPRHVHSYMEGNSFGSRGKLL